ncbi:MAG TPA: PDZ domain-containing protein [Pyrinomonadaceae bacterium]|nr:PDZ domain-containing protein [Pyrinomonadaceae bacterium]
MQQTRRTPFIVLFVLLFLSFQAVQAQKSALKVDYTVTLSDTAAQQFHVTTDIKNINQPRLDLSLPTWTPGWYTVENYLKNVLRFRITDASGKILPHTMSKKQTWNVDTRGIKEIKIDYDYRATVLALNQAKITKDYAFFTGIELFLQAEGHRDEPSTVHFALPAGWKIITALKDTSDPMTFTAANYDVLVDAPVEMGNFDVTKFEVEGKPHYLVANPAGTFSSEKAQKFAGMLAKVAEADSKMFGGLPYEKYVYFYFFAPPESNASGALEHLNSFVSFAPSGDVATPEMLIGTASHEFFHLWNVKRIRPAEMWPYDYSRENETPLLWVSEGFTNYYGVRARYRAGLMTEKDFLASVASAATGVENTEAREYISPAESSVSTWVGYDSPTAFSISYYTQGQNLGALLDLSIRNDTDGRSSLDDVMRTLFSDFYKRGKGFTTEDMISIINRLTKKDYHDFYRRYIFGTEVPDYNKILGYAGYKLDKTARQSPVFGFGARNRSGGLTVLAVEPDSPATAAGLKVGDIITKINGEDARRSDFGELAGKTIKLSVRRGSQEEELTMNVGSREFTAFSAAELPNPDAKQLRVRESWLKR